MVHFTAEITRALLSSLFGKYAIRTYASLGTSSPNYIYPLPLIFGVEVLNSALLMAVILIVVHYANGLKGFAGLTIDGIVRSDTLFLAPISGAS